MENHKSLQGLKTKPRSLGFSPVWTPEHVGEWIKARFIGTSTFPVKNGEATSFNFALLGGDPTLVRNKEPFAAEPGTTISVSGKAFEDAHMSKDDEGKTFVVTYDGETESKQKGRSGMKLFDIHEVLSEPAAV